MQRLSDAGQLKRALVLVDREELRDQAHGRFHNVFGADAKIVRENADGSNAAKNARIHIATYQSLGIHEEGDASFLRRHYPENHLSHILIDECHRSAWGKWSEVLTRNPDAFQIGLTATPRQLEGTAEDQAITADNHRHFGEPVYEYSLTEGVEDGYLAPCEIKQGRVSIDEKALVKKEVIEHKARRADTGRKPFDCPRLGTRRFTDQQTREISPNQSKQLPRNQVRLENRTSLDYPGEAQGSRMASALTAPT